MGKASWHRQFKRSPKASRTDVDGKVMASKSEFQRWQDLQLLEKAGEVRSLRKQVPFELKLANGRAIFTPKGRVARYVADFVYEQKTGRGWEPVVEDSKGFYSRDSQFRISVFEAIYGIKVYISGQK
jgi:hypothetical protein